MAETTKRTIRRPFFSYAAPVLDENEKQVVGPDGLPRFYQRVGYRGDVVDLYPADASRGDRHGVFLAEGETLDDDLSTQIRLSDLGLLTDEQLKLLWNDKAPKQDALLDAVGENSDLAVKVIGAEKSSAKPRKALIGRLQKIADGFGASESEPLGDETEPDEPTPSAVELGNLAGYSDDDLAAAWKADTPNVKDVLDAVGDDPALAQKALNAENAARGDDARVTLTDGLAKVIAGGNGS